MLKQPWVDGYYAEAARAPKGEHLFFVLYPYVLSYTPFPERETQYVIMRGSRISGKNITALGGSGSANRHNIVVRERACRSFALPPPSAQARIADHDPRGSPMLRPATSTDDGEAVAESFEPGSLREHGFDRSRRRDMRNIMMADKRRPTSWGSIPAAKISPLATRRDWRRDRRPRRPCPSVSGLRRPCWFQPAASCRFA